MWLPASCRLGVGPASGAAQKPSPLFLDRLAMKDAWEYADRRIDGSRKMAANASLNTGRCLSSCAAVAYLRCVYNGRPIFGADCCIDTPMGSLYGLPGDLDIRMDCPKTLISSPDILIKSVQNLMTAQTERLDRTKSWITDRYNPCGAQCKELLSREA